MTTKNYKATATTKKFILKKSINTVIVFSFCSRRKKYTRRSKRLSFIGERIFIFIICSTLFSNPPIGT